MFKLSGLYQLPFDWNVSMTFNARDGHILRERMSVTDYTLPNTPANDFLTEGYVEQFGGYPDLFSECGFATAQAVVAAARRGLIARQSGGPGIAVADVAAAAAVGRHHAQDVGEGHAQDPDV